MKILVYLPCLLLLFYTFSIFFKSDNSFDQDLGRHLKLGEIIANTHQVPKINLFSYTYPEFPFINHHFLFEVFIYLWSRVLNLQSLLIFKISLVLFSVILLLSTIRKPTYPLLLPIGYIFLHILRERTDLRPEIFSFFFTACTIFVLEKFIDKKKTRYIYLLPLVQLIWVNTHIYFFLGLTIQAIYIFDFYLRKEYQKFKILLLIILTSFALSLLNPNFINGLLYPFRIFTNYGYTVAENQNLFLLERIGFQDNNFLFVKLSIVITIASLILSLLRNPFSIKNNAICLLGVIMSLANIRSFPYLVFLSLPFVLKNLNFGHINKKTLFIIIASGILLFSESVFYLNGNYYKESDRNDSPGLKLTENGKSAMDFVVAKNLSQPVYNNFDIGSYIIYRGYPKYRVFVDGRPEGYPASFFQETYIPSQENPQVFADLDLKYKFQTIIFSITDQTPWGKSFLDSITKNPDWVTVYLDNFMIILVKSNRLQEYQVRPLVLNNLNPTDYNYSDHISFAQMSYFLINTGNIDAAKKFAKKAWEISPDSHITRSLLLFTLEKSHDLSDIQLILKLNKPVNSSVWW